MDKRIPGEITTLETRSMANEEINKEERYKQIIKILANKNKPMTAKEISIEMCMRGYTPTDERNFSSPRLTEMMKNGKVEQVGKKKCQFTKKMVTLFELRN